MWIQTRSGAAYEFAAPEMNVRIDDIAHALSNLCRFNGHTRRFYSVAEHSCRMAIHATRSDPLASRAVIDQRVIVCLAHDAHEAYVGDVASPLKQALGSKWTELEDAVASAVRKQLGVPVTTAAWEYCKRLDQLALTWEARELMTWPTREWGGLIIDVDGSPPLGYFLGENGSPERWRDEYLDMWFSAHRRLERQ